MNLEQKKVLNLVREISRRYKNDPIGWIKHYINFSGLKLPSLTFQQEEIASSLIENKYICVSAGGGVGKTALTALLIQWFLVTHPFSKIPTTAPSGKQLNDILWSEIDVWLKRNRLAPLYTRMKGKLYIKGFKEWYAVARTVPKDKRDLNDTLAGFHAPHLLICVDEASGVPDPVFTALVGAMTDKNSYIILISNPVSTGGFYYDIINDPEGKGQDFKVLYFSALDSPLVDENFAQTVENIWGKDSPMYRAKVLGLPIEEDQTVVVTPERFDKIVSTQKDTHTTPVVLAVDVAGGGPDMTVILHRVGDSLVRWDEIPKSDPTSVADDIVHIWKRMYASKPFCSIVDAIGIGAGTYSNLVKEKKFPVIGFIGSENAFNSMMYANKRTEGYHKLQKDFPNLHFPTPPPERLKKELANLRFIFGEGQVRMESKKEFKQRLGFSPDYADPLMMSCMVDNFAAMNASKLVSKKAVNIFSRLTINHKSEKFGRFSKFLH